MKLSTRSRYGTRALIEIARNYNRGPTKRKDIARTQGISEGYLESILSSLRAQHVVRTVRGSNGGFALERRPDKVTLLEIVRALEGGTAPIECVETPDICDRSADCAAREAWKRLHEAQNETLRGMTLQDLVTMGSDPMYTI